MTSQPPTDPMSDAVFATLRPGDTLVIRLANDQLTPEDADRIRAMLPPGNRVLVLSSSTDLVIVPDGAS